MAGSNYINSSYWSDSYILELSAIEKMFYLYLLTKSSMLGIFSLSIKMAVTETDINEDEILRIIAKLEKDGKVAYSPHTREICLRNWLKNNFNYKMTIKQTTGLKRQINEVKNKELLKQLNTNNTFFISLIENCLNENVTTQTQEQEQEQEQEQLHIQEEIKQEQAQEEYDEIQEEAEELLQEQIKQTLTPEQIQKQEKRREIERELEEIKKLKLIPPTIIEDKKEDKSTIPQNIIDLNEKLKQQQKTIKNEFTKIGDIASQNIENLENNKSIDNNSNDNARRKTDNEYQQLYDAYPKKRNFDAGYFEFLTLSNSNELPPIEDLLHSLEDWKATAQWEKPQFIPTINNWLKNKKFLIGFGKAKPQDINAVING